ncbi:MAG: 3-hydroxyacyl-CoA dehydrogenase NAD-binding domain-containing protein [Acidobacteriota bacterium]
MTYSIESVAVIGAGTMGAAIAAHVANAGLPVLLLDIVPRELTEKEAARGANLDDRAVRDRIARDGLERIAKLKPASFMSRAARSLVSIGNLEDDLERLAGIDWIVEAVVERLDIKRDLMARIDAVRHARAIVTTNTSGLPIHAISEGRSDGFRRTFFGTHFFNPPRYMKLLEVIRGDEADPLAVSAIADFATRRLGKGVVFCRDTPNFIGNRILSVHGSFNAAYALDHGYRFEEVDALTGPLIGRPKTASFRLQDLVGIDIAWGVAQNLHGLIEHDERRDVLAHEGARSLMDGLISRGWIGNKAGRGFYRKQRDEHGKTQFLVLDPETFEYRAQQEVRFPSVDALAKERDLGARVLGFFDEQWGDDRGAQLVRAAVLHLLSYAAHVAPEVAYDLHSIDRAVRWGFGYEVGPFELWDRLGVAATIDHLEAAGQPVAPWVVEMLEAGCPSFYQRAEGRVDAVYDWVSKGYEPATPRAGHLRVDEIRSAGHTLRSNASASLHHMGEGVLLFEIHSKANAIDGEVVAMLRQAHEMLDDESFFGLVIGNDGKNFSVGADLRGVGALALQGDFDGIGEATRALQHALAALRRHGKPVVAAVHGMALGGGAEIALGADRIIAHAESYIGLVEVGVGLIPGGGGLMELVRRQITPAAARKEDDPLPAAQRCLETVAMAKVSTSAAEAGELGFLRPGDRIVMNRDLLLTEARQEVLAMVSDGYLPAQEESLYAGGAALLAALEVAIWSLQQAGWASPHDAAIARRVARVLSGGDATAPMHLSEEHFLALERAGFVELVQEPKTQDRMRHMLETGKPLRN